MPKPTMLPAESILESQIIDTMKAALQLSRPDLSYPQSHSDMQACVRGILRMFSVERRPIAAPLKIRCDVCNGTGSLVDLSSRPGYGKQETCVSCGGKGWVEG